MNTVPRIPAPLDPGFQLSVLWNRAYLAAAKASRDTAPLIIGLERECGLASRYETVVKADADADTLLYVERIVKFLLRARGGGKTYVGGPSAIGEFIRRACSPAGTRKSDCKMMELAYGRKLQVVTTTPARILKNKEMQASADGHLEGCRIGFDLGASDYKVSAVVDGETVFTEEVPWDPKNQANLAYHYHHISAALHRAASHLPRVDAIGGSTAGIVADNEIRVASLLHSISTKDYPRAAKTFKRIQKEWNVPLLMMNDGDVTALAGALSLREKGMLGTAMGSSEAGGFIDKKGRILGWLNELAFASVD